MWETTSKGVVRLKSDAVPTIFPKHTCELEEPVDRSQGSLEPGNSVQEAVEQANRMQEAFEQRNTDSYVSESVMCFCNQEAKKLTVTKKGTNHGKAFKNFYLVHSSTSYIVNFFIQVECFINVPRDPAKIVISFYGKVRFVSLMIRQPNN